jgi:hypothetical protein
MDYMPECLYAGFMTTRLLTAEGKTELSIEGGFGLSSNALFSLDGLLVPVGSNSYLSDPLQVQARAVIKEGKRGGVSISDSLQF